jgi:hypothetical protein
MESQTNLPFIGLRCVIESDTVERTVGAALRGRPSAEFREGAATEGRPYSHVIRRAKLNTETLLDLI